MAGYNLVSAWRRSATCSPCHYMQHMFHGSWSHPLWSVHSCPPRIWLCHHQEIHPFSGYWDIWNDTSVTLEWYKAQDGTFTWVRFLWHPSLTIKEKVVSSTMPHTHHEDQSESYTPPAYCPLVWALSPIFLLEWRSQFSLRELLVHKKALAKWEHPLW